MSDPAGYYEETLSYGFSRETWNDNDFPRDGITVPKGTTVWFGTMNDTGIIEINGETLMQCENGPVEYTFTENTTMFFGTCGE